jgi:hypothetical protein
MTMAIDQTELALNLCTQLQAAAESIMRGVEDIARLKDQKESAGVDFTAAGVEAKLAASSLRQADGNAFNSVISSGAATKTWLEANFHDDNFQKVRSGGR